MTRVKYIFQCLFILEVFSYEVCCSLLLFIHDILARRNRSVGFTITSCRGTWGLMHINGILITKQLISH